MKVRHRLIALDSSPTYKSLKQLVEELSLPSATTRYSPGLECFIDEDDPLWPEISVLAEKRGIWVQTGVYYEEADIDAAEWVWAIAGEYQYPQPMEGDFRQATYDLRSYCRICGVGAVQDRPFRLARDFRQKSNQFLGLHVVFDVMFLRPPTKRLFESEGITGVTYDHPVLHKTGKPLTSIYQMHVTTLARPGLALQHPPIVTCKRNNEESQASGLRRLRNLFDRRPFCHRVKYNIPRTEPIAFQADALRELPDIVMSHEYFGSAHAAFRLVLVRSSVVKLVKSHGLKGLKFTPVMLVS